ncbi:MAG: hypothetical protein H0X39_05535 [Actinobacteria bacterium]|nr:hypothetical protein [Actinomycetota bacterium]
MLWIVALSIEYPNHLQPPAKGWIFYVDQLLFTAAMLGWTAAVLGLIRLRAAGGGKLRFGLFAWALGIALLVLGNIASLTLHAFVSGSNAVYDNNPLFPLGGIISTLAALLAGIGILRARRMRGWGNWSVLAYAVYYICALFIPLILGHEPNFVTEAGWGAAWIVVGVALTLACSPAVGVGGRKPVRPD